MAPTGTLGSSCVDGTRMTQDTKSDMIAARCCVVSGRPEDKIHEVERYLQDRCFLVEENLQLKQHAD